MKVIWASVKDELGGLLEGTNDVVDASQGLPFVEMIDMAGSMKLTRLMIWSVILC